MYQLQATVAVPKDTVDLWTWRGSRYLLRAVPVAAYRKHMRVRSPKWDTVGLPGAAFRALARPFHHYCHEHKPALLPARFGVPEENVLEDW